MPVEVLLSKPLQTHQGEVTKLTLRDFTAKDIAESRTGPNSLSYVTTGKGANAITETRVEIRYDIVMTLLAKASGVDEVLLGLMSAKDFDACSNAIVKLWSGSGE